MRRLFHKVVCTAPGVTTFGNGVLRVKCKQNTVVEMPCGVWLANWRRHSDKLFIVDDSLEEGTVYPPVAEPKPVVEAEVVQNEAEPEPEAKPKRTYNKKDK